MDSDWTGMPRRNWENLALVRARLDAGADPNAPVWHGELPLHVAARDGSPEVVAELARRVDDIDADHEGRTALWLAVYARRPENARVLAAAGADPWRPMMGGWSPGQLSLAGPTPFPVPPGEPGLSDAEAAMVAESAQLIAALDVPHYHGTGLACVADIDAAEAARRLEATPIVPDEEYADEPWPFHEELDDDELDFIVGATDVPGGCVITQPWGYLPRTREVTTRLSAGTLCYGMYANPKSGNQGSVLIDGVTESWDVTPGGEPIADDDSDEILLAYLYRHRAIAYACAYAGLKPSDARAVTGPPDVWLELTRRP
ncbi:ankyrin repeat domain-containing protein [Actinomadura rugatobispora]|uniref:Ankyrin repeat domain-containing protein n=1 Tax=Actinomadura rugatobispora TaxID=1994 RepID=A0ABW0ZTB4_9ACTN|nr:hypothetical protein GCM10010200_060080 [Actinomadura rugatobispora]